MKIESIKQLNITFLLSEMINHSLISQPELLELFKDKEEANNKHNFIQAPGLTVLAFPERGKEIIFEANRLLFNDNSTAFPEQSDLIGYVQKVFKTESVIKKEKIAAVGFNFTVIANGEKKDKINYKNILNKTILESFEGKTDKVQNVGFTVKIQNKNFVKQIEITPLSENKLLLAANYHYENNPLAKETQLKKDFIASFDDLLLLAKKIDL